MHVRQAAFVVILILCGAFTVCPPCSAQNGALVNGTVVDSSGATIANAVVSMTDLKANTATHTITGADGQFAFNNVAPGPKRISVEKSGFDSFSQQILVAAHQPATVQAKLTPASMAESVVVRGTVNPEAKPVPSREDVMITPEYLAGSGPQTARCCRPCGGRCADDSADTGRQRHGLRRDRLNQIQHPAQRSAAGLGGRGHQLHRSGLARHHLRWHSCRRSRNRLLAVRDHAAEPGHPGCRCHLRTG